jgi:hypothetical protein
VQAEAAKNPNALSVTYQRMVINCVSIPGEASWLNEKKASEGMEMMDDTPAPRNKRGASGTSPHTR